MKLAQALRLGSTPRLALVGAGGKTTALFRIARELSTENTRKTGVGNVLVTATTHLATDQLRLADQHFSVASPEQVSDVFRDLPAGVILLTGDLAEAGRVKGLDCSALERLFELVEAHDLPLLVEADGSRQRPLKAPAAHEPALPAWIDTVCVFAGLSGIGRPLAAPWVHRPERFAVLAEQPVGSTVEPAGLARLLLSPDGGLKNIPTQARRVAVLNQADTIQLQALAYHLAPVLLAEYHAVLVSALAPGENPDLWDTSQLTVHERVAGVALAAGGAARYGQPKQLLPWRRAPFVRHVALTALQAGLDPVVIVTGAYTDQVRSVLDDLPVVIVENPTWPDGQSTSVRCGLNCLPPKTGAAIFLLADQPQVPASLVRSLVEVHSHSLAPIVAPLVDGQRGNPVLFDRSTFTDLMGLSGDAGGRALFARYPVTWLPWLDSSLLLDVDRPEDYARLLDLDSGDPELSRGLH